MTLGTVRSARQEECLGLDVSALNCVPGGGPSLFPFPFEFPVGACQPQQGHQEGKRGSEWACLSAGAPGSTQLVPTVRSLERRLSGIGLHSHSGRPCIDTRGGRLSRARGRKSSWSELPWEPPRSEPSTREGTSPLAGGVRNTALVVLTLCYVTCGFLGFPNLGVRRAQIGALEGVWGQGDQAGLDKALLCARGWLKSRSSLNSPDAPAPAR